MIRLRSLFDALTAWMDPACPCCHRRRLRWVQFERAPGGPHAACWSYHECESCDAQLKWDTRDRRWVALQPGEWARITHDPIEPDRRAQLRAMRSA